MGCNAVASSNPGNHLAVNRGESLLCEGLAMDRILILDNDAAHADALVRALRRMDRSIETCADTRLAIAKCLTDATDVLIVVPASPRDWKEQLSATCATLKSRVDHPAVLCVLRWMPQGPMDRLFGDALGIEVQHER